MGLNPEADWEIWACFNHAGQPKVNSIKKRKRNHLKSDLQKKTKIHVVPTVLFVSKNGREICMVLYVYLPGRLEYKYEHTHTCARRCDAPVGNGTLRKLSQMSHCRSPKKVGLQICINVVVIIICKPLFVNVSLYLKTFVFPTQAAVKINSGVTKIRFPITIIYPRQSRDADDFFPRWLFAYHFCSWCETVFLGSELPAGAVSIASFTCGRSYVTVPPPELQTGRR